MVFKNFKLGLFYALSFNLKFDYFVIKNQLKTVKVLFIIAFSNCNLRYVTFPGYNETVSTELECKFNKILCNMFKLL